MDSRNGSYQSEICRDKFILLKFNLNSNLLKYKLTYMDL